MKKLNILASIITFICLASCSKDFLMLNPQGQLSADQLANAEGIEGNLIAAYGIMNGNVNGTWGNYASAPSQWVFGEMASDNAHKGTEPTDQPNMNNIEAYTNISTDDNIATMWRVYYEGVLRCNSTLRLLAADQAGPKEVTAERASQIQGEARMLRAHYYFYLWRVFRNIPYVDENTSTEDAKITPNNTDVVPMIIADLEFAIENLPADKINGEAGRMDSNIAKAYLGKVFLYQKQYSEALTLFNEVMAGKDIVSMPFENNFDVLNEDGPEALLVSKHAINSNGSGDNANVGDMLSGLYGTSPVGCCGFYQPTIELVNAFKVGADGLPFLDGSYKTNPYISDIGAGANYILDSTLHFDPRLDYTVGRRGVMYLDYGVMPGNDWIRDAAYGGPFVGMKTMIPQGLFGAHAAAGENYLTGLDVNIIRLADVILMAAECEIELNNLERARTLVNQIRTRASNLAPKLTAYGNPAANYSISNYATFPSQEYARNAVRFERRLELAMEGHRFYDLVRWGIAKTTLEAYSQFEGQYLDSYDDLIFNSHNEYQPIPQEEIDKSNGFLEQNTGY
ncbi:RagB/SusD family nutrient uptake outer membrane protein [Sphingobacterium hungaricum]|uniref:RagB/SusD family nutrient uptake outer membrane protein n=1 Tax=Sphingobacterium hungaricum TaxID=2082723 RepID=A0A928UX20_9SPHI|nr:RagB/SusD family nutrient uptake outer membrane protein [Sphingobacterium hungaricum]MBE8714871.1 RagB/SusD family nutrient uptake outer membrane protein [Sphingobacterium hungaricum]